MIIIKDAFKVYMNSEYISGAILVSKYDNNIHVCYVCIKYKNESFDSRWGSNTMSIEMIMENALDCSLNKLAEFVVNYQLSSMESEW